MDFNTLFAHLSTVDRKKVIAFMAKQLNEEQQKAVIDYAKELYMQGGK